jgi:hypothetical protein
MAQMVVAQKKRRFGRIAPGQSAVLQSGGEFALNRHENVYEFSQSPY